ncbi:MAG TPA: ATP-grasp domain-containing protein [Usitatibacter sp.]|nr:ATP-grasp domain-containing protein [Usitatibacter sp.]
MKRRVLVLFPDEWDLLAARDPRYRDRYEFHYEGFDLFSFPDNARLFTFDALRFVEKMVARYRGRGLHAVVTSDEQFGPFLASLIGQRLGLPHSDLQAVLAIQHKYHARQAYERIAPEANARFGLLRRGFCSPDEVPLAYPFYVKPAKAAFSVLARRVDSFESLYRHTRFAWFERQIIDRLVRPFAQVMRAHSALNEDPFSMVVEEVARGPQVTANGFVRDGKVTMLGTVDSIMYPGTDQFRRFQYPSSHSAPQLERVDALARRLIEGMGLATGVFNIEMRLDPASGNPRVIEINPRAAGQFYDLFERVDGYNLFEVVLALHCGDEPEVKHREGCQKHAASFVLRDLSGEGLSRWPSSREIAALAGRHPEGHFMAYRKRGADLAREMKWLGSYRYGVFNTGGATLEEMFASFARLAGDIDFHPASRRPEMEKLAGGFEL